ncbi:MAG: DJ-1/PfpI family protein [Candidatus Pacebacteria bacterium]|nr:DJ-1/PfpI family protein [Candidatus Paceibacterota bacterium]
MGLLMWSLPLTLIAPKKNSENLLDEESFKKNLLETMEEKKKILMVVSFDDFRDEEYFIPKEIFEQAGFEVETTSLQKGIAKGILGGEAVIDLIVEDVQVIKYEAVVFCGGSGMAEKLDNEVFQNLAKDFNKENKLITAICVAPALLAKAGILKDKEATVWSSALNKDYIEILKEKGTTYKDESVVISGQVVTANGPEAAKKFGETIIRLLKN